MRSDSEANPRARDDTRARSRFRPGTRRWALLSLLVASALILPALGHKDLWIDEADSVYFAQHAWSALLFDLCDPHPPAYYALLKLALALGGTSEFVVRLPSALAGILAVAVLARLSRELAHTEAASRYASSRVHGHDGDPRPALLDIPVELPAALLAVAPLAVWYAQEARMYALVALFGLGAALFAVRLVRRWRARDAAAYLACASAALLADQSALLVVLPVALFGILRARRHHPGVLGRWIALHAAVLLPFALWLWRAGAITRLSPGTLYPLTMVRLTLERWAETIAANRWAIGVAPGLTAVAVAATVLWARRARHRQAASRQTQASPRSRWGAWTIVCLYGVGTLVSVLPRLYTLKRLVVSLLPYALIAVAWAIARLGARRLVLGIALVCSLTLSAFAAWSIPKDPWRTALLEIAPRMNPADTLWVDELAVPIVEYYSPMDAGVKPWRASDATAPATSHPAQGRLWLVAQATRYRNLFHLYPALDGLAPDWSGTWPGIEIRAYEAARLGPDVLRPQTAIPDWLRGWPSPLDEACQAP